MSFKAAIPNDICRVIHRLQQSKFVNFLIYVSTLIRSTGLPLFSLPTMEVWECQLRLNHFQQLNDENARLGTIISNNWMTRKPALKQSFTTIEWREYQLRHNCFQQLNDKNPSLSTLISNNWMTRIPAWAQSLPSNPSSFAISSPTFPIKGYLYEGDRAT